MNSVRGVGSSSRLCSLFHVRDLGDGLAMEHSHGVPEAICEMWIISRQFNRQPFEYTWENVQWCEKFWNHILLLNLFYFILLRFNFIFLFISFYSFSSMSQLTVVNQNNCRYNYENQLQKGEGDSRLLHSTVCYMRIDVCTQRSSTQ